MTLSNKRETYDIVNSSNTLKLVGTFTYTLEKTITNFNGNFFISETIPAGNFNYGENVFGEDETANKTINSFPISLQDEGCKLLDETIKLIKSELGS